MAISNAAAAAISSIPHSDIDAMAAEAKIKQSTIRRAVAKRLGAGNDRLALEIDGALARYMARHAV